MVRDWPRDAFPRQPSFQPQCFTPLTRHPSYQQERGSVDVTQRPDSFLEERYVLDDSEHHRFREAFDMHRRQPPMQIDEALRAHCGIAAKQYFVAAVGDDGKPITFFSPGQNLDDAVIRQFFDVGKFQQVMARIDAGSDPAQDDFYAVHDVAPARGGGRARLRPTDRRRSSLFDDWDGTMRQGRNKRPRPRHPINEDADIPMTVSSRKGIKIGDADAVWSFYERRFKNCQQTACKLIAKAWVKAVEPKKQSTHPYTGSDEKAPDWWPKPWGPTKDDKVRHKEPDHLYKRERVHLLAHILRLVVEPIAKQHSDVKKLNLNVKKLEETTYEALSSFFMDNDLNAKKRPYLCEIFKVARQEERYKNGEIDGTTEVYVMAEDKIPDTYASDNDDGPLPKEEDEDEVPRPKAMAQQQHCVIQASTTVPPPTSGPPMQSGHGPYVGELPVRGSSFNPGILSAEMHPQPHAYVDGDGLAANDQNTVVGSNTVLTLDMVSGHNASRRPSVYSEYASPGGNNLYASPWQQQQQQQHQQQQQQPQQQQQQPPPQQQAGTVGQTQPSMYTYAQSQSAPSQAPYIGQAVPMRTDQPFGSGSFEEPGRPEYHDTGAAAIFRPGQMPHTPVSQEQGFYVSDDGRAGMRVLTHMVNVMPRNQM